MARRITQEGARKKLLTLLPRSALETLAGNDKRPWHWGLDHLRAYTLGQWDADTEEAIAAELGRLLEKAKQG